MAADVVHLDPGGPVFEFVGRSAGRGITWAWARQDLDMASARVARAELAGLSSGPDGPDHVLVHLGPECFVDLEGFRVLVDVSAQVRLRGGALVVVAPPRCLRMIVTLFGLDEALPLATTAQEAVRRVRAGGPGRSPHPVPDHPR